MIQTRAFQQANFIGALPQPNNDGVCFSLSLHWLTHDCEDAYVVSIADAINTTYEQGSANRSNQIQEAANQYSAGTIDYQTLLAVCTALYPGITNIAEPIRKWTSYDQLVTAMTTAVYDTSVIWLVNYWNDADRGHVVALHRGKGVFFDANTGFYEVENDLHVEIASYLHRYKDVFNACKVVSIQIT